MDGECFIGRRLLTLVALRAGLGRLETDGSVTELDVEYPTVAAYLAAGCRIEDVDHLPARANYPEACAALRSVAEQVAVWGIGMNYRSKQEATGRPTPAEPTLFLKAAGSVTSPGTPLPLPAAASCVDYEAEVAVVVARPLFEADPVEAADAIGGVVAANDITARDVMRRTGNPSLAKGFPGFGQFGSAVAVTDSLGGLSAIDVTCTVNGELRQKDDTSGLLLHIPELLSLLSRYALLRPGDLVLTGTPAGTGDETERYLCSGDVVEVTVGGLPSLRTSIAAETGEFER